MSSQPPDATNDAPAGARVSALLAECFNEDHNACVITRVCQLRRVLGEAAKAFNDVLNQYTVADLISERPKLARILSIPIEAVGRR